MAKGFNINVQLLAQTQQFNRNINSAGKTMNKLKGIVAGAFAVSAITQFGKAILDIAGDFEHGMARVKAVSNATTSEMKDLTATARKLGATTQYSAIQASEGLKFLVMAGIKANDAIKILPDTLNLATAADVELGESADVVSDIMTIFKKKASEASDVTDDLTTATTSANTTLLDLFEALKLGGATANSFGLSLKSTNTILSLFADNGLKATVAGTNLRNLLLGLNDVSKSNIFKSVGLDAGKLSEQLRSNNIIGFITDIKSKLGELSKDESLNFARAAFGKTGMNGFLAMLNTAEKRIVELQDKFATNAGEASRVASEGMGDYVKAVKGLSSAYEDFLITLGSGGEGTVAVNGLTGLVKVLAKIADNLPVVTLAFSALLTVAGKAAFAGIVSQLLKFNKIMGKTADLKAVVAAATAKEAAASIVLAKANNTAGRAQFINGIQTKIAGGIKTKAIQLTLWATKAQEKDAQSMLNATRAASQLTLATIAQTKAEQGRVAAIKTQRLAMAEAKMAQKAFITSIKSMGRSILGFVGPMLAITAAFAIYESVVSRIKDNQKFSKAFSGFTGVIIGTRKELEKLTKGYEDNSEAQQRAIKNINDKYSTQLGYILDAKTGVEGITTAIETLNSKIAVDAFKTYFNGLESAIQSKKFSLLGDMDVMDPSLEKDIQALSKEIDELNDNDLTFGLTGQATAKTGTAIAKLKEEFIAQRKEIGLTQTKLGGFISTSKKVANDEADLAKVKKAALLRLTKANADSIKEKEKNSGKEVKATQVQISALQSLYNEIKTTEEALKDAKGANNANKILVLERALVKLKTSYSQLTSELTSEPLKIKLDNSAIESGEKAFKNFEFKGTVKMPDFSGTGGMSSAFDAYTDSMKIASNEMQVFGDKFTYIQQQIQATIQRLESLAVAPVGNAIEIDALKAKLEGLNKEMRAQDAVNSMNDALNNAAVSGFAAFSQAIEDAVSGTDSFGDSLLKGVMSTLGTGLKQIGAALVAYGVAMEAFKKAFSNPWAAIGAGVALMAAGAVLSGRVSKMNSSGSTSSASTSALKSGSIGGISMINDAGYNSATGSNAGLYSGKGLAIKLDGEFKIKGTDLVISLERTTKKATRY